MGVARCSIKIPSDGDHLHGQRRRFVVRGIRFIRRLLFCPSSIGRKGIIWTACRTHGENHCRGVCCCGSTRLTAGALSTVTFLLAFCCAPGSDRLRVTNASRSRGHPGIVGYAQHHYASAMETFNKYFVVFNIRYNVVPCNPTLTMRLLVDTNIIRASLQALVLSVYRDRHA